MRKQVNNSRSSAVVMINRFRNPKPNAMNATVICDINVDNLHAPIWRCEVAAIPVITKRMSDAAEQMSHCSVALKCPPGGSAMPRRAPTPSIPIPRNKTK